MRPLSTRHAALLLLVGVPLLPLLDAHGDDAATLARIEAARLRGTKALADRWTSLKNDNDTFSKEDCPYFTIAPLVACSLRRGDPKRSESAKKVLAEWWDQADAVGSDDPDGASEHYYRVYQYADALEAFTMPEADQPLTVAARASATRLAKALTVALRPSKEGRRGVAWAHLASLHDLTEEDRVHPADQGPTLAAVLALRDAARAGVEVDRARLERVAAFYLDTPWDDEPSRFQWHRESDAHPGPCAPTTPGGVAALTALVELGCKDERIAPALEKGRAALVKLAKKALAAPPPREPHALHELGLALDLGGIATIESKDWFAPLATKLIATQKSTGLWNDSVVDTCAAILFLARTPKAGATTTKERR